LKTKSRNEKRKDSIKKIFGIKKKGIV